MSCQGPGNYPGLNASCCPGLTTSQWGGAPVTSSSDGSPEGGDGGTTSCACPTNCIPIGQPVPPTVSGCGPQPCCPPSTNQGGTCTLPPGVIVGTYKTQYMPSGSTNGGANFAAQQQ
jgi:hypothetical protein